MLTDLTERLIHSVQLHILRRMSSLVPASDNTSDERTEVIYGVENVTKFSADGLSLVENRIDVCGDYNMPSVILDSKK